MTKRFLFVLLIVGFIFSSISAISAADNESLLNYNPDFTSQDGNSISLSDSDVNNNIVETSNVVSTTSSQNTNNNTTSINASDVLKYYRNGTDFEATLYDSEGNPIAGQTVTFDIVGLKAYNLVTNENGTAALQIMLYPGNYKVHVIYNGVTGLYDPCDDNASLVVIPAIVGGNLTKYYLNGSQYSVTVMGKEGPEANVRVGFDIVGKTYYATTDKNGVATLAINLYPGTYSIVTRNLADTYKACYLNAVVTVLPTVISSDLTKYYRNDSQFNAVIIKSDGTPLANSRVAFDIVGKTYYATTNNNGVATLTINLYPGTYSIVTRNLADGTSAKNVVTVLNTITVKDLTKGFQDSQVLSATVVNGSGDPSVGTQVNFAIKFGNVYKVYTRTTDSNGIASLTIDLNPGTYSVITTSSDNGYGCSNTIKVVSALSTYINTKDSTIFEGSSDTVTATVYNDYGYAVYGADVTLTVAGKTYTAKSDRNGVVTFTPKDVSAGTYSATYKLNSFSNNAYKLSSTTSTINVLSGTDVIFNASDLIIDNGTAFNVTVNYVNNTPVSDLHMFFTIDGVNYAVVTNSNGVASIVVNGSGIIPISYTVNETGFAKKTGTSNVMVLSTHNTTLSTNISEILKNEGQFKVKLSVDSIPLANQQVTIIAGGKSYYVYTDSEGWAYLTIDLNAGNYSFICKFNGTSDFENTSATFNVTVVESLNTTLTYLGGSEYVKDKNSFVVLLTDQNGNPLANQKVIITVKASTWSKSYTVTTGSEGTAGLEIHLNPGYYTLDYVFEGSSQYKASAKGSYTINVVLSSSNEGYGYWLFGADMYNVNLQTLASQGTNVIFLNYYAFTLHGQKAVTDWIQSASNQGIKVHIWMQVFYDGKFISPVLSNGSYNYDLFNEKINEAKYYAGIAGVAGIHLDYLRFPGTAYQYSNGVSAINDFVKMLTEAVEKVNPNILVSAAVMPETTADKYYYGQDIPTLGNYLDIIIPMVYKGNYQSSTSWITTTTQWFVENSGKAQVWSGLQTYKSDSDVTKLSTSELTNDANAALAGSASGVILFRYGVTNLLNFNNIGNGGADPEPTGTVFTKSEIQQGAKYIKEYMESNGVLPTSVTVGSKTCTVPQFLYLMALYTANYNTQSSFAVIGVSEPSNPSGDAMRVKFNKNDFVATAGDLVKYMETYKKAPDNMNTAVGKMMYSSLVYSYAKIVNFVIGYGQLPNYVYVTNIVEDYSLTVVMYPSVSTSEYKYIQYRTTWLSYCPHCGYYGTLLNNPKGTTEGELTCSYCDCDYCGVTGKEKVSTSTVRLTALTTPVPVDDSGDDVSLNDIITAAKYVKGYYEANGQIPEEITLGTGKVTSAQFLYLLSKAIGNIMASDMGDIDLIDVADPEGPFGDLISSSLTKAQYTELANRVAKYIVTHGQAPNYANSDVGRIVYDELIESFSRILAYYGNNGAMPNTVAIKWTGGDSSSVSDLAQSLISGLTSDTSKATALYNYVRDKIDYEFYYNTQKGAEGTLVSKAGNCCDQAQLLVAMARSVGLTCRFEHATCTFSSGNVYGHVWVQFNINGQWVNADPTSTRNSFGVINNWKNPTNIKYYDVLPF